MIGTNSSYDVEKRYTGQLVSFTVLLSIYSIFGTFSNTVILIVYVNKSVKQLHNLQIRVLGVTDLVISTVVIPYAISFEWKIVSSDIICRGVEFFRHFLEFFSNSILCLIALERYFAVLKPMNKLTYTNVCVGIWSALAFSIAMGLPAAILFSVRRVKVELYADSINSNATIMADVCTYSTDIVGNAGAVTYQLMQTIAFVIGVFILIILYAIVYRVIWKRARKRRKNRVGVIIMSDLMSTRDNSSQNHQTSPNTSLFVVTPSGSSDPMPRMNIPCNTSQSASNNELPTAFYSGKTRSENLKTETTKAGTMLFACTVIYVVTWIPFFIEVFSSVGGLSLRYVFLASHVTNPLVYSIFNKDVRNRVFRLFSLNKTRNRLNGT
ncbi:hypothetical protein SNE40_000804 [Patella caerulea]|uniref:G-protein coupled receptors family 1 profile domain-containing protein n=1 Tax=Patella caerulea TaxID=87958 RepID=A0AAN8KB83_PATCE